MRDATPPRPLPPEGLSPAGEAAKSPLFPPSKGRSPDGGRGLPGRKPRGSATRKQLQGVVVVAETTDDDAEKRPTKVKKIVEKIEVRESTRLVVYTRRPWVPWAHRATIGASVAVTLVWAGDLPPEVLAGKEIAVNAIRKYVIPAELEKAREV